MAQPLTWQAGVVEAIKDENARTKTFTFRLPQWNRHRPGQHYDLRLTAPDGYQAERSYSIASAPERDGVVELTIERIDDGEVSPYMHDVVRVGDRLELRGPIGGYFVWEAGLAGALFLVGGGSGVVPLMAMLRHRAANNSSITARLLYSSRSADDVIYGDELKELNDADNGLAVRYTFTRAQPPGWAGYHRRIDRSMLLEVSRDLTPPFWTYVCGPTVLVELVANQLLDLGVPASSIRTERFGPTGQ